MPFCSKCGKEVEEGKNFCSSCGASLTGNSGDNKPKKKKKGKGCVLIFILLIFLCVFFASLGDDKTETTTSSVSKTSEIEKQPEITISAADLLNEYDNNELRAQQMYKGKRAQITGFIREIDNTFGMITVMLYGGRGSVYSTKKGFNIRQIGVRFSSKDKDDVSALNKEQKITVICTVGDGGMIVNCKDSKIVK